MLVFTFTSILTSGDKPGKSFAELSFERQVNFFFAYFICTFSERIDYECQNIEQNHAISRITSFTSNPDLTVFR
jgi:hypothetical protein